MKSRYYLKVLGDNQVGLYIRKILVKIWRGKIDFDEYQILVNELNNLRLDL